MIEYLPMVGSYSYSCDFGCFEYGYRKQEDAERALEAHDCEFRRFPGGVRGLTYRLKGGVA